MNGHTTFVLFFFFVASASASLSQVASPEDAATARFVQGTKTRRRSPQNHYNSRPTHHHRRIIISPRQDTLETASPSPAADFELTSVSPIQSSLGGLTGLQGLPPLSLIQFVKLLIAVTPFILPLIFVPLLLFTVGMFMIPVNKANVFFDDGGDNNLKRAAAAGNSNWAINVVNTFVHTDKCLELVTCHLSQRVLNSSGQNSVFSRNNVARLIRTYSNAYPPPPGRNNNNAETLEEGRLSRRILLGVENDDDLCSSPQLTCSPTTLIQKLFFFPPT